jgi:uncharacterized membrane protein
MIIIFAALGVMVAAIAALALGSWLILVAVLALHLVVTTLVVSYTLRRAGDTSGKPDAVTEARVEEERATRRGSYPHARAGTS